MAGWKTKVGACLAIAAGILGYGVTFFGYQGVSWDVASGLISGGFVALGLGHKADRLLAALKDVAPTAKLALIVTLIGLLRCRPGGNRWERR